MTISQEFKDFTVKVRDALFAEGLIPDTYQLLNIADALYVGPSADHNVLVQIALEDDGSVEVPQFGNVVGAHCPIVDLVADKKRINAIKRLRALTDCGLKEAKLAIEDPRVTQAADLESLRNALSGDPWAPCPHGMSRDLCETPNGTLHDEHYPPDRHDDDEPPF
jgi:hypothetical protein